MIEQLRAKIRELEAKGRFNGRAYPEGIELFPKTLVGQGFFPGGDGLWREDEPSALRSPGRGEFPDRGIMFLGNDFGTLASFTRLKLHENPPTWRFIRKRLMASGISGQLGFFTNAYLGLRADRDALAEGMQMLEYDQMCDELLAYQVNQQRPKLVVVLGDRPCRLVQSTYSIQQLPKGKVCSISLDSDHLRILAVSHPFSDLRKSPTEIQKEGTILRETWNFANR